MSVNEQERELDCVPQLEELQTPRTEQFAKMVDKGDVFRGVILLRDTWAESQTRHRAVFGDR